MKVHLVNKNGDEYPQNVDLEWERMMFEKLIYKGFRPIKGDYFQCEEGNGYKVKWINILDENKIIIAINL